MDRVRHVVSAAALASIAGGPLLIVMTAIDTLLSGDPVHLDPDVMVQVLGAIAMVGVIGWFVAIAPNLLGTAILGWLGRDNVGMRFPAIWAIVGAGAGGMPMWLAAGPFHTWRGPAAMAGIGAISALLCRARVRWDDDAPRTRSVVTPTLPQATP